MSCDDAGTSEVRRFEVFTGRGKRRDWPADVRMSIIAESYAGKESISSVARRHAVSPSQLFTWRRLLRKEMEAQGLTPPAAQAPVPAFVPAMLEPLAQRDVVRPRRHKGASSFPIEMEIGEAAVRIANDADPALVTAVIAALRAAR